MFEPHDGRRVEVPAYRQMMGVLLRGRNESAVYFKQVVDLKRTLPWLDRRGAKLFHLILHALAATLHDRERLNRFTVGRRTYQRTGVFLSFAAKKAMSDDAPLAMIKREFAKSESFGTLVAALSSNISDARSATPSALDQELALLLRLPAWLLSLSVRALRGAYALGVAPRTLVDTDPMYTSAFVANLGSIGLDAAYHHLYEHGNCPLFVTVGKVANESVTLRFTFDERVEDGLYAARSLELLAQRIADPASWIG